MVVYAASGQIRVEVRDENGLELPYVNTVLLTYNGTITNIGAAGDEHGVVNYGMVKPGEYQLLIQTLGYVPDTIPGLFITGTGRLIDLGVRHLRPDDFLLDEVVITGKAPTIIREANQLIYNIENTTLSTGETALTLLTNVPGVIVNSQSDIVVNGKDNVLVMIDGRQQYGTADEISDLLLSLSSESIRQVEVQSAASSKFDASGSGAVINIVSKRSSYTGVNGSIWTRYRQGRHPSGYAGNNLNWKYKKFSGNAYYYFSYYQGYHDIGIDRIVDGLGQDGQPVYFSEQINERWTNVSHAPRLRLFYDINDNHRLGMQADLSWLTIDFPKESVTEISDDGHGADSTVISDISVEDKRVFPSVNLFYQAYIGERSGTIDLAYDFFSYSYDLVSEFSNQPGNAGQQPVGEPSVFREISALTNLVHTAAFDFSRKLKSEHYIGLGAKASLIDKVSDTKIEVKNGDEYEEAGELARDFDYREDIFAGYVNWSAELPRSWTAEAGLRVEHTRIRQQSINPESSMKNNYTDYFPFVSLFKETDKDNSVSLSYSRRTLRPTFDQLNPFVLVINPFLVVSGDPGLVPQINNLVDLEFSFAKNYSLYAGYNLANNSINSVFLDEGEGVYNLTYKNFDRSHFLNTGFTAIAEIRDWWSLTGELNVAYDYYNVTLEGEKITRSGASATVNVISQFELPREFHIDLSGIYESPRYTSIEYYKSTGRVDVSLTKYFLDKAISLKFRGRDIFYTSKYESSLDYLNLQSDYLERSGSRRFEFTFTYRYRRGEDFKPRRTKSSNKEEKDRT
jgi:hypothetical protein